MLSIYQNLNKTFALQTEKRGCMYVIVKKDIWGNSVGKLGVFETQEKAERELADIADDSGYRWVGRQDK
jgi:hypothetical protein